MTPRFSRHFTPAEATALIPEVTRWLHELRLLRQQLERQGERLAELLHDFGDQGGPRVNDQTRALVRWQELQNELARRCIQIRNLETGQLDFPSFRGDHEIFLVWQEGDTRVEAWREIPPR